MSPLAILRGQYHGKLDPRDTHNQIITDLTAAPRLSNGHVDSSDVLR